MEDVGLRATLQGANAYIADAKKIQAETGKMGNQMVATAKDSQKASSSLVSSLKGVAVAFAGAFVATKVVSGIGDTIAAASDLAETINKAQVVFGEASTAVLKFGDDASQALGQSKNEAIGAAAAVGNLFLTTGLGQQDAADMSMAIVKLASDLASFNNIDPTEALVKLRSGLVGESEPLRTLGVLLSEEEVTLKAVELGLAATTKEVTQAAKVQARYALIMEQTKTAQGDFANTSKGLANSQRILAASWKDIQAQIGSLLLPTLAKLTSTVATKLPAAFKAVQAVVGEFAAVIGPVFTGIEKGISGLLMDLGELLGLEPKQWASSGWEVIPVMFDDAKKAVRGFLDLIRGPLEAVGKLVAPFAGAFKQVIAAIVGVKAAVIAGAAAWAILGGAIALVTSPLAIVAAGLVAVTIAWKAISDALAGDSQLKAAIHLLQGFGETVRDAVGLFAKGDFEAGFGKLGKAFTDWLLPLSKNVLGILGTLTGKIVAWIGLQAPVWAAQVTKWAAAFLGWVGPLIPPLLAELANLAGRVFNWIASQAPGWATQLATWGAAFLGWIGPLIPPLLAKLGEMLGALLGWLGAQVGPLAAKIGEWAKAFIDWIAPMAVQFLKEWPAMLDKFLTWIGDQVGPILNKLGEWAVAFIGWIVPMLPDILKALGLLVAGILVFIAQTAGVLAKKLLQLGLEFVKWIAPQIPGMLLELGKLLIAINKWILLEALPAIVFQLAQWGVAFLGWIVKDVLPSLPTELAKILTGITTWIAGAVPQIVTGAADLGRAIVTGILDGIGGLWQALTDAISQAINDIKIDIGPFHLSAAGFRIDAPSIPAINLGAIGARAEGGPINKTGSYLVGERGPELVTLQRAQTVVPANMTRQIMNQQRSFQDTWNIQTGANPQDVAAIVRQELHFRRITQGR